MALRWEYTYVEGPERKIADLVQKLNAAGALGWEAFGIASLKKGITADSLAILLKRERQ